MKIALQISGQMRFHREAYKSLQREIIDKYKPDIFMHTWSESGKSHKDRGEVKYSFIDVDELRNLYKPKLLKVEDFHESYFDEMFGVVRPKKLIEHDPVDSKGTIPMYYGIAQANNLRKQYELEYGVSYSAVIRCRPDICIDGFRFTSQKYELGDSFILTVGPHHKFGRRYIWDPFFIADPKTMDFIASIWDDLEKIFDEPLGPNDIGINERAYQMAGSRLLSRWMDSFPDEGIHRLDIGIKLIRSSDVGLKGVKNRWAKITKHLIRKTLLFFSTEENLRRWRERFRQN